MRRYELMLLFRPDLEDEPLQSAVERVTRAIVNAGGSLSKISPWGKRRLAYPIQHHRDASYFLIHFDIDPSAVREIERGLLISEDILRHLVVVLEPRRASGADLPDDVDLIPDEDGPPDAEAEALGITPDIKADGETEIEAGIDADPADADLNAPEEVAT